MVRPAALCLLVVGGCIDPIDARWQLDHDHVVAARATPPRIRPGDATNIDALVAHAGRGVSVENPLTAEVVANSTTYYNDAPASVDIMLTFARTSARATQGPIHVKKTVFLGEPTDNPALPPIAIDGQPAGTELVLPIGRDVFLEAATDLRVNWLTSAGTLFQDDEPKAFLRAAEPATGELVVVVRDSAGGVVWQVWPLRIE